MKKIITFIVFALTLSLFGEDIINGKILRDEIPDDIVPSDLDLPRNIDVLAIKAIVEKSDNYLKENFGKNFEVALFSVSLSRQKISKGFTWRWHIVYHYPETDEKNKLNFFKMVFSLDGEPYTSIITPKK